MKRMYDLMKNSENKWEQYKQEKDKIQIEYAKMLELNNQLSDIVRFRSSK